MRYLRFIGGSHDGLPTVPWVWQHEFPPGQKKEIKLPKLRMMRVTIHPDDDPRGTEFFPVETYVRRFVTLANYNEVEAFVEEGLWNTEAETLLWNKLFELGNAFSHEKTGH